MNKDILWALLCNKQNKVQKQNLYILLNRYQIFKIFKTKKMKNLNLKDCVLVELNQKELKMFDGGDIMHKNDVVLLDRMAAIGSGIASAAHQVGDFFRGVWNGLK